MGALVAARLLEPMLLPRSPVCRTSASSPPATPPSARPPAGPPGRAEADSACVAGLYGRGGNGMKRLAVDGYSMGERRDIGGIQGEALGLGLHGGNAAGSNCEPSVCGLRHGTAVRSGTRQGSDLKKMGMQSTRRHSTHWRRQSADARSLTHQQRDGTACPCLLHPGLPPRGVVRPASWAPTAPPPLQLVNTLPNTPSPPLVPHPPVR